MSWLRKGRHIVKNAPGIFSRNGTVKQIGYRNLYEDWD